jgi:hypothetical protein
MQSNNGRNNMGYIYCMSNKDYYGRYKIGMTMKNPEKRLKDANSNSFSLPYNKFEFVKRVSNARFEEKRIHRRLKQYRIEYNRELFNCPLSIIRDIFESIEGENYIPEDEIFINWILNNIELNRNSMIDMSRIKREFKRNHINSRGYFSNYKIYKWKFNRQ